MLGKIRFSLSKISCNVLLFEWQFDQSSKLNWIRPNLRFNQILDIQKLHEMTVTFVKKIFLKCANFSYTKLSKYGKKILSNQFHKNVWDGGSIS